MKLRFLQNCKDKNTGKEYNENCEYVFDDARAKEILATGLAEVVEGKAMPKTDAQEEKKDLVPSNNEVVNEEKSVEERLDEGEMVNLHELTKNEVVELAKKQGISTKGSKDDIIERLLSSQN